MPITALPTPPQPSDSPATFNSRAFDLLGALPDFVTEANALEAENAAAATAAANAVLASKTTGPASATDNTLPRFDGTTGKLLQGSGVVVDDSNNLGVGVTPSAWGANWKAMEFIGRGSMVGRVDTLQFNMLHNAFYDGTTFKYLADGLASRYVQNSGVHQWSTAPSGTAGGTCTFTTVMTLDTSGNLTLSAGTLGYGAGAGGTVTQATSKATTVTLNKPSGQITMNASALAAGATEVFALNNTFIGAADSVVVAINRATNGASYNVWTYYTGSGTVYIAIKNISGGSLSDAVVLNFAVIKGSTT